MHHKPTHMARNLLLDKGICKVRNCFRKLTSLSNCWSKRMVSQAECIIGDIQSIHPNHSLHHRYLKVLVFSARPVISNVYLWCTLGIQCPKIYSGTNKKYMANTWFWKHICILKDFDNNLFYRIFVQGLLAPSHPQSLYWPHRLFFCA